MEFTVGSFRQTIQGGSAALAVVSAAVLLASAGSAGIVGAATATTKPLAVQKTRGQYEIALRGTSVTGSLAHHRALRVSVRKRGVAGGLANVRLRGAATTSYGPKPTITLRDLNGDRFPDGIVTTYTGGAHCCWVSSIAFSTSDHTWALPVRNTWTSGFRLRHLNNDGVVELVASDGRFDYAFGPHAVSAMPVTIHRGEGTRLVDVSTRYPGALRADADSWRGSWEKEGATRLTSCGRLQLCVASWENFSMRSTCVPPRSDGRVTLVPTCRFRSMVATPALS